MSIKRVKSQKDEKSQRSEKSVKSNPQKSRVSQSFMRQLHQYRQRRQMDTNMGVREFINSAMRFFVCKLCYNNVEMKDTDCFGQCGHTFCTDCLTQYSIYKIKVHQQVLCPEEGCKIKLQQSCQFFKKLPQQIQLRFKQYQIWRKTLNNPNIKLCPGETCRGGIVDLLKDPPQCQKCLTKYCKQCMMAAHEGPCDQNFQDCFQEWKRCPKCKMFIHKLEGCNHMKCTCHHEFCFVCLGGWDSGHYQCVQGVNNRLFFSQVEQLPKQKAVVCLIGLIFLFPLLIILGLVGLALSIVGASIVGIFAAPIAAAQNIYRCCNCFLCCLIIWLIAAPIASVLGAIGGPIIFAVSAFKPFANRMLRKYCNSFTFLMDQSFGVGERRRRRRNVNI